MNTGPILVTGAGGFVGGHVARHLAAQGRAVRGFTRKPVVEHPGDPPIEWVVGDLLDPAARTRALKDASAVVHAAGWVSLGPDHAGRCRELNVVVTERLLADAIAAGVGCFIYTSSLYTLAAGGPDDPADEQTPWNLQRVDSPYTRSKRAAESLVLAADGPIIRTIALCPGMVLGPRDPKPTSTAIIRVLARNPMAILPPGGIPIIDAGVLALAHERALDRGPGGQRYAVVGPYLSYPNLARIVKSIAGRPYLLLFAADFFEPILAGTMRFTGPVLRQKWPDVSHALVAGGFMRMHVSGARADREFSLVHPTPEATIASVIAEKTGT